MEATAASTISVFGDKRQFKDGDPGKPAFDLLSWIPSPLTDLFEKEAVINIYFNTDTDGIIKDPKTGKPQGKWPPIIQKWGSLIRFSLCHG